VLARFSDFTGIPEIPDTVGEASPRGLALKFDLGGGDSMDVVAHSFNGFPAATTEEFRELLLSIAASGKDAPKPTPLDDFLAGHPCARNFLSAQKPPPVSYATLAYYGVNAFAFSDAEDNVAYVRHRFAPLGGEAFLSKDAVTKAGPDYLAEEI